MTIDAEAHRVIHHPLGHGHLCEVAMARRAIYLRADMRGMIETNMRLLDESIDALPRHVFVPFRMIAKGLDSRIGCVSDVFMTRHAYIDAGNSGARPFFHAKMTICTTDADIDGVNLMRKIDWLLWLGFDAQEMPGRIAETGVRRRERWSAPSLCRIRIYGPRRISRHIRLLHATRCDSANQQQDS
jgi:hypothetical protein